MARKRVDHYATFQNVEDKISINVYYRNGGADTINDIDVDEAKYITDILRNENPVDYDHNRRRFLTGIEMVGETEGGTPQVLFNLNDWILSKSYIKDFISFESPTDADYTYAQWSNSEKAQLNQYYQRINAGNPAGVATLPALAEIPPTGAGASTKMSGATAWNYYLAFIAQSLVMEVNGRVNWSISSLADSDKSLLLDSRSLFQWDGAHYTIQFSHGVISPGDPFKIHQFLTSQNIIKPNHQATIIALIDWARDMTHFSGGWDADNMEDHWQYRGFPPIERVIAGTDVSSRAGTSIRHYTAGCWGTTGFLRMCLRVLNIPATLESRAGHALPNFTSINRYLSHGDDPYNALFGPNRNIPTSSLLLDQTRWDQWFGSGVNHRKNIGRQTTELALQHLPNYLLNQHCQDLSAGNNHANSRVFGIYERNYTLAELEAMNLWQRMDTKIRSLGGCALIPSR